MLLAALERQAIRSTLMDVRSLKLELDRSPAPFECAINRCISQTLGLSAVRYFEAKSVTVINSGATIENCGDKALTSILLAHAKLPVPRTIVAHSTDSAFEAAEAIGYPVVMKPVTGSWGRLVVKLNDRDAAEAVFAHKEQLPSTQHSIYYIQEFIAKPDRDIRAIVIGRRVVTAYYRCSSHWITNVRRGAIGKPCVITPDIEDLAVRAAEAVGGGVLSVDLFESPRSGLLVNEVNHTTEFVSAAT